MKHTLAFIIVLYIAGCSSNVRDRDGNEYSTVQIGEQTWMAENLRTTQYADGTPIANITDDDQWSRLGFGAWVNYINNPANDATYGKLYNWYAVANSAGLCPKGWHVPSYAEWTVLFEFLGEDAGFKMKSTTGWDYDGNGSNESGFNALPGGDRSMSGHFRDIGRESDFWTSSEYIFVNAGPGPEQWRAWPRQGARHENYGFSVRCLRD